MKDKQFREVVFGNKKLFSKWLKVRWECISNYFNNNGEIFPCMFGQFVYNNKTWECNKDSVFEVTDGTVKIF